MPGIHHDPVSGNRLECGSKSVDLRCGLAVGTVDKEAERVLGVELRIMEQPAPLLVPLAEEGWVAGDVPTLAAERYLEPLVKADVDTIVLGCTHYPLLSETIHDVARDLLGHDVVIVDSAEATASALTSLLETQPAEPSGTGSLRVLVTDLPGQFATAASRFLGAPLEGFDIKAIDL